MAITSFPSVLPALSILFVNNHQQSLWASALLWIVRIATWSLLLRTYLFPWTVALLSKHIRIQSLSFRSIRGFYFCGGSQVLRIDRITYAWRSRRLQIKIYNLKLELRQTQAQAPPPPRRHVQNFTLADFAPSPLAYRLWSLAYNVVLLLEPFLRPLARTCVVAALKVLIRWLPALAEAVEFDLHGSSLAPAEIPGVRLIANTIRLHTGINYVNGHAYAPDGAQAPQRLISRPPDGMVAWKDRLSAAFRRSLNRAWGATQVTVTLTLSIEGLNGVMPAWVPIGIPDIATFFTLPASTDFSASARFNPREAELYAHSLTTMLKIGDCTVDLDGLRSLLHTLKATSPKNSVAPPPEPGRSYVLPDTGDSRQFFPSPTSISPSPDSVLPPSDKKHGRNFSTSPLFDAFSTSLGVPRKQIPYSCSRLRDAKKNALLSALQSCTIQLSRIVMHGHLAQSEVIHGVVESVAFTASLSDPGRNPLHCRWLGKSHHCDRFDSDVYDVRFSTQCITIKMEEYESGAIPIPLFIMRPLSLQLLLSQWPSPWLRSAPFLAEDPNAALLVIEGNIDGVQCTESLSHLSQIITRLPTKKGAAHPQHPLRHRIPVPRIIVNFQCGPIAAQLFQHQSGSPTVSVLEARMDGLICWGTSRFDSAKFALSEGICSTWKMIFDYACVLRPLFVRSRVKSTSELTHPHLTTSLDPAYMDDPAFLSVEIFEVIGHGRGSAVLNDADSLHPLLDITSLILDIHGSADAACIELWHPDVIDQLSSVIASLRFPSKAEKEDVPTGLTIGGLSVAVTVPRLVLFVTSPDLNPDDAMELSRGFAIRTGLAIHFSGICPLQSDKVQHHDHIARLREELYLPPLPVSDALDAAKGDMASEESSFLRVSLFDLAGRSAVSTKLFPDDPLIAERDDPRFIQQEFLRIPNTRIDIWTNRRNGIKSREIAVGVPYILATFKLSHVYNIMIATNTLRRLQSSSRDVPSGNRPTSRPQIKVDITTIQIMWLLPTERLLSRFDSIVLSQLDSQPLKFSWSQFIVALRRPKQVNRWDLERGEKWVEVLSLHGSKGTVDFKAHPIHISIDLHAARFRIPFGFVLADFILDSNLTFKAIRHLVHTLNGGMQRQLPDPGAEGPKIAPSMTFQIGCLSLEAADDPLESRLSVIWRTGSSAVLQRMEREEAFIAKVAAIQKAEQAESHELPTTVPPESDYNFTAKHTVPVEDARRRLQDVHALDYALRLQILTDRCAKTEDATTRKLRGTARSSTAIPDLERIESSERVPPLFRILFNNLYLHITQPTFPLEHLPEYIFTQGNGLPKDTEFSLLVPMHLALTASSVRLTLRDYPLPLFCVPANQDAELPSVQITTNLVIAEEMGTTKSVEWFDITVLDQDDGVPGVAPLHFSVPKTILPVKTYADPVLQVTTEGVTSFAWGVSYGPAIQDLMRVVETLSSPPRDPSPVLGFWDKMRLVLHGSLRASFTGEVRLYMKGSRDPYCVDDIGAGFVFAWQGHPQLLINYENAAHEFLQVTSDSMCIAIPDLKYDLASTSPQKVTRQSSFKKVCAKFRGGTCFGIGFVPERPCGSECVSCDRTHSERCRKFGFSPHYTVILELKDEIPEINGPQDSYRGFRSEYVHLSVSLTSSVNRRRTSNFHFTPKAFSHFWSWWALFDSTLSLPVRQGSYFPPRHITPKLGRHLATIKYRIVVPQLFVLHAYLDDAGDTWGDGVTPWVGVKGLFEDFLVDMHQREEVSVVPGATPDSTKVVRHKPFCAAEVVLKGAEIRTVLALFDEPGKSEVSITTDAQQSSYRSRPGLAVTDLSSTWYDADDFIELDWMNKDHPTLHLLPLANCPWFTYFKRSAGKAGIQATHSRFANEESHVCILGQELPINKIQMSLASARLLELEEQIRVGLRAGKNETCHGKPLRRMADLLKEYIGYLANPKAESPGAFQYRMASEMFSQQEWDEFEHVYQVHCPKIFMDSAIRDIMIRYYYCSRERRGLEYHMAERAVKFIRDQANVLQNWTTLDRYTQAPKEAADIATSTLRRMFKGEFGRGSSDVKVETKPLPPIDKADPLNGWSEGVSLCKSHCCLLLKPQIVLRADSEDATCIVAAMQCKLQTYTIMDNANVTDPVSGKIMSRNYASVSGLQTFAPTTPNCPASGDGCLPLEVLIDYRCESSDFDRLVPQTDATFQYDKFNRLRLCTTATTAKASVSTPDSGSDHLGTQTDVIRVHIPRFQVTADDDHFKSIQRIVTQLLLFSDVAHKTRLDKLQTLYFTYDFTDLVSAAQVVADLQSRLRAAMETERNARLRLHYQHQHHSHDGLDLLKLRAHIYLLADKLSLVFDAIKMAQDQSGEDASQKSALLLHASSSEISWHMLDDEGPDLLAKLVVQNIHFFWLNRQDSSTVNNLAIGDLQAFDGSRQAVWTEILSKHNDTASHIMHKKKLFLVADWVVLPPVNGIAIYETFELALHPLRLQIDAKVGRRIMEYVWPARRNRRSIGEENQVPKLEIPHSAVPQSGLASGRASLDSPRTLHGPDSPLETTPSSLAPPALRRLGVSRSFTDLRSASENSQPFLHRNQSTDVLSDSTALQASNGNEVRLKQRTNHKTGGAAEMKTRSTQKSFVHVRVASFNLLLSIAKEGSFEFRDARIKTRELEYRNQTWSFEDLVNQFIPSDTTWRGWVKMAFHQPLVPVIPVARELLTKTKWIKGGVQHEESTFLPAPDGHTGEGKRDATSNGRRPWKNLALKNHPPSGASTSGVQAPLQEPEAESAENGEDSHDFLLTKPRTRVLTLFKRSNSPRIEALPRSATTALRQSLDRGGASQHQRSSSQGRGT